MAQTNVVHSNDDQGRVYKNCKFNDPRSRGSCAGAWQYKSFSENALFFKNFLLYTQSYIRQTESIEMMKNKESTKVVKIS